tara:strand:- start:39 stop:287 length:249 start_codon:yes stop_codon:yes gene_type:complete
MNIDLSETKPVYEIHIWYHWDAESEAYYSLMGDDFIPQECIKFDDKDKALEAYHKLNCSYKILMEYAGDDGDALLEYSRGDE